MTDWKRSFQKLVTFWSTTVSFLREACAFFCSAVQRTHVAVIAEVQAAGRQAAGIASLLPDFPQAEMPDTDAALSLHSSLAGPQTYAALWEALGYAYASVCHSVCLHEAYSEIDSDEDVESDEYVELEEHSDDDEALDTVGSERFTGEFSDSHESEHVNEQALQSVQAFIGNDQNPKLPSSIHVAFTE